MGRLEHGVTLAQVDSEVQVVARRLLAADGQASASLRARARRVWLSNPENWGLAVLLLLPVPLLVLAIACVNAANLMLARGSQRQREIAIRLAIGAGRVRIVRQLLMESGLLALLATAIAVPVAWSGLQLITTPLSIPIQFDPRVLGLAILTTAVTTVAFGLLPALRISAQHPSSTLGSVAARRDALPRQSRLRRGLVLAQLALSLGLLATGWQLVATVRAQAEGGGVPGGRILLARFDLRALGLPAGEAERFYAAVVEQAAHLPDVEAVGVARQTSVWSFGQRRTSGPLVVWRPDDAAGEGQVTSGGYAGGALLQAVGLQTVEGRLFSEEDRLTRPQVAVVNKAFAQRLGRPAIGSTVRVAPHQQGVTSAIEVRIVGVIELAGERRAAQGDSPPPGLYLPSPIEPEPALTLYVRTGGPATTVAQPLRELVGRIATRAPIVELGSLNQFIERASGPQLWLARAAAVLGFIGLLLATAGLYGVTSYVVAMRSREIAIRMAVGASPRDILTMVVSQSLRVGVGGLLVGGAMALVASMIIQAGYHGIQGIDGAAFGGATALFLAVILLASLIPALRASHVDPIETLKDA